MAGNHKAILLPIISSFNAKGVRDAQGALGGLGKTIKGAAGAFVAFQAVAGTIDFATGAITQARDLQRNLIGLKTVFGDASGEMQKFAEGASTFGLSTSAAAKASTFLGSVLKSAGFDMKTTQAETKKLTALASDLAVTYGYDVQEALTGMTALFRGEYDPIEKFGVAMKQSQINAILASRGMDKLTGSALLNAQQQVRLELLYQNTADAQGAATRGAGTLFVEQMRLTAAFENMQATVGSALLPVLSKLMQSLVPLVDKAVVPLTRLFEQFGKYIQFLIPLMDPLMETFDILVSALTDTSDALAPLTERFFLLLADTLTGIINPTLQLFADIISGLAPLLTIFGGGLSLVMDILTAIGRLVTAVVEPVFRGLSTLFTDIIGPMTSGLNSLLGLTQQVTSEMTGLATTTVNPMTGKPWNYKKPEPKKKDTSSGTGETAAEKRARKERERIAAQKKAYADLAKSIQDSFKAIRDSMMSAFDITKFGNSGRGVLSNIRRLIEQTKKFAVSIKALAAQGLNSDLLNQLIAAGPMQAGRLAANLVSSGAVTQLNSAYSEFGALASDIANTSTTAQFMNPSQDQYQIYVNAGIGDKNTIGKAIVEAIKTYERQSGAAWRA